MTMDNSRRRILKALLAMDGGPEAIEDYLLMPFPGLGAAPRTELPELWALMLSSDPNEPARLQFSDRLHAWDNSSGGEWTSGTPRNTDARRERILLLLGTDAETNSRINLLLPRYSIEEPVVIAVDHIPWYPPARLTKSFYWAAYIAYLRTRGWQEESILALENSTKSVVERFADPTATTVHATKGLVVGYVQSGKTANFTGVIARAADAGYRLIIVLAGTWNILRSQTQRRLDKELIGKELLDKEEEYANRPDDWDEFISHGDLPEHLGTFNWERLTNLSSDYRRLGAAIAALDFTRRDPTKPFYDPDNLKHAPTRLVVMKKNSAILKKLIHDLTSIRARLADIPTLVIDDESDQAGLNTLSPDRRDSSGSRERTKTNRAIVGLLGLFPRGQYVGYTATPYANALVDLEDAQDLFPRDYILSLDRPKDYMGVSDFFDATLVSDDVPPGDFSYKENAFIRDASDDTKAAPYADAIERALASFVLAGAVKLFRAHVDPKRYSFRHHTMLVHTGSQIARHEQDRADVEAAFQACAFSTPGGLTKLRQLWEEDYSKVSAAQGAGEVTPEDFGALTVHIGACLDRLQGGPSILVLNQDSEDAPDFTHGRVWCVVVGGNKLSRGYTIEGLTVSYYRRVANQADTLMQMGRWFGFRKGYRDLVRVFIGRSEGHHEVDLVDLFKQACLMEEDFRADIRRYAPMLPRIKPVQIPPLISLAGDLQPTSRNKMWNAVVKSRNYGDRWSMPTRPTSDASKMKANEDAAWRLISHSGQDPLLKKLGGRYSDGKNRIWNALVAVTPTTALIDFLAAYQWLDDSPSGDVALQREFLAEQNHGIVEWLIIAPQMMTKSSVGPEWRKIFKVKHRQRLPNGRFQLFGEPDHRAVAEFLVGKRELSEPSLSAALEDTASLRKAQRGVILIYPVRDDPSDPITMGFEILFPGNDIPAGVVITTRRNTEDPVIDV
jgi:hypothetical protein